MQSLGRPKLPQSYWQRKSSEVKGLAGSQTPANSNSSGTYIHPSVANFDDDLDDEHSLHLVNSGKQAFDVDFFAEMKANVKRNFSLEKHYQRLEKERKNKEQERKRLIEFAAKRQQALQAQRAKRDAEAIKRADEYMAANAKRREEYRKAVEQRKAERLRRKRERQELELQRLQSTPKPKPELPDPLEDLPPLLPELEEGDEENETTETLNKLSTRLQKKLTALENKLRLDIRHLSTKIYRIEAHVVLLDKRDPDSVKLLNTKKPLSDAEIARLPIYKQQLNDLKERLVKVSDGDVSAILGEEVVEFELSLGNVEHALPSLDLGLGLPDTILTCPKSTFRS